MSIATSQVAAPYAQALLSIAKSKDSVETLSQTAGELLSLMKESDELSQFLSNPIADKEAKRGVIKKVLGDDANVQMKNFMMLLVDKGRIALVKPILEIGRAHV